jgi:hypothetical protein
MSLATDPSMTPQPLAYLRDKTLYWLEAHEAREETCTSPFFSQRHADVGTALNFHGNTNR